MTIGRYLKVAVAASALGLAASAANAGSVYLTGHDVDFHGNQNGYSTVILNYLRGAGTTSEIAAGSYNILFLRSDDAGGSASPITGFGTVTTADVSSYADAAAFGAALSSVNALVIASHTSCGGCDFSTSDSNLLNSYSSQITSFFNAGGDIYANSGASLATYYNFLPLGAVASGAPISGSSGFDATNAGDAIGITSAMINGFATHNRFTSFAPAFTVFETRPAGTSCNAPPFDPSCEIISIGVRDAAIDDGGIVVPPPGTGALPEPGSLALVGLGALGFLRSRRKPAA